MTLTVGGGEIAVTLPEGPMKLSRQELLDWVKASADSVARYYGRFPVSHLTLQIRAGNGSGVGGGVTYPRQDGGLTRIRVGRDADVAALKEDWKLTHEMVHLAFPDMPDNQHWIEEGIATYVEPIARARAGRFPVAEVWKIMVRDMPQGQPEPGDQGLDHTPTWGRTYWGGAMFCLMADVQIRERTHNRKGLQDALRAIIDGGGSISHDWTIEKVFAMADKGTGTTVLEDLYKQMRDKPVRVDLDQVWHKLGVEVSNGEVRFNDKAKEAKLRRAITS